METNLGSLVILTIVVFIFAVWLFVQLYKHDHPNNKKDFDYWS
jgi:hypothetical protein